MNDKTRLDPKNLFREEWHKLTPEERDVIEHVLHRISVPRDPNKEFSQQSTFGGKVSDAIAGFGGSWTFIMISGLALLSWTFLNTEILGPRQEAFDPYPYVFLNLVLSMMAAFQAPIIMMSQNRQSMRDRLEAEIDHEVNVRAEMAIRNIDERMHRLEDQLTRALKLNADT